MCIIHCIFYIIRLSLRSVSSIVQYIPDSASGHHAAVEVFRLIDQALLRQLHPKGSHQFSHADGVPINPIKSLTLDTKQ